MAQLKKKDLPPTYYFMSCGCKLHEKDIKRHYNQKVCREHGGYLVRRTRPCLECGVELKLCKKGNGKLRCPECEAIEMKRQKKIVNDKAAKKRLKLKPRKPKKVKPIKPPKITVAEKKARQEAYTAKSRLKQKMKGWSVDFRGDYCRNLFLCMRTHKVLPCDVCDKYNGIFRHHDPVKLEPFVV